MPYVTRVNKITDAPETQEKSLTTQITETPYVKENFVTT